jgi:hypothetical protein
MLKRAVFVLSCLVISASAFAQTALAGIVRTRRVAFCPV